MTLYLKICSDYDLGKTVPPFGRWAPHVNVFRGDGFMVNAKRIKTFDPDTIVLSNDETIMTMEQFFKKDPKSKDPELCFTGKWDIYYWRNNKWMKLQDCTEKELRFAHNLTKILLAGGFDD